MKVEKEILEYLDKKKSVLKYKGIRVGFLGLPDFEYYKYQTLANNFSSLIKRGLIRKSKIGEYYITYKGKEYLEKSKDILENFKTDKSKNSPKDLLVVYDIPENKKRERDWFRYHLKKFYFVMIQRSVWVGPSPLPKEFLEYLKKIKMENNFRIFKLKAGMNVKQETISS